MLDALTGDICRDADVSLGHNTGLHTKNRINLLKYIRTFSNKMIQKNTLYNIPFEDILP